MKKDRKKSRAVRVYRQEIYEQLARIGKAMASGPRLEILDLLGQAPRTVENLASQVNQSVANTSHHLQVLRRVRLIESERDGVHIIYRLADERVSRLFIALRHLAEARLLEMDRISKLFLEQRGAVEPLDRERLIRRVRAGEVTILDVRPAEEYRAGHIPGAVSMPMEELEQRLDELPKNREIVAYCRGPYCVMALDAVERLLASGFEAKHLDEGVPEWWSRGFPVEGAPDEES